MVQAAQDLGVRGQVEAGKVEESQQVAVAEIEEEMIGALIVAVLENYLREPRPSLPWLKSANRT